MEAPADFFHGCCWFSYFYPEYPSVSNAILKFAALVPKDDRRNCDCRDGDEEWQDRSQDVGVNQEQASGRGADEQRDEHAGKATPFHNCRGPVSNIAHKE